MIMRDLKNFFKHIFLKSTSLLTSLLLKICIIIILFVVKLFLMVPVILEILKQFLLLFIKALYFAILKMIPLTIFFIVQSLFDAVGFFIFIIIKILQKIILYQQYFLNFLNKIYSAIKWQSFLSFNIIYDVRLRNIIIKDIKIYYKHCKNSFKLKYTIFITKSITKINQKSKKQANKILSITQLLFARILNKFLSFLKTFYYFIINIFSLLFFIIGSFYKFLITLLKITTYKKFISNLNYVLRLVVLEVLIDVNYIYKILIKLPFNFYRSITNVVISLRFFLNKVVTWFKTFYLKSAFLCAILIISIVNITLLYKGKYPIIVNNNYYTKILSITNTIPALVAFIDKIRNKSLIEYKQITLNIKDYKELNTILLKHNMDNNSANQVIRAINIATNYQKLPSDSKVKAVFISSNKKEVDLTLSKLEIPLNNTWDLVIKPSEDKSSFTAYKEKKKITKYLIKQQFVINDNNYYISADNSKVPERILDILNNILSWHIDFQREISTGNSIELLYECLYNQNELIKCDNLIYASAKLNNKVLNFYYFKGHYYLEDGKSASTFLLRTPIQGYRISSKFGKRVHPILGYTAFHKGVDFAVPTGTPIPVAGNGVIKRIAVSNSFGNIVEVQHNQYLSTLYAHMNAFAKNIHVGQKVSQRDIIGYVGSTGWATGPHLHYEIHFNNNPVNPMDVKIPSSVYLQNEDLSTFNNFKKEIYNFLLQLPNNQKTSVAFNNF